MNTALLDPRSNPDEVKSCCSALYSSDWARLLLGDSFHPGGIVLTTYLANTMALGPESVVLDIATGQGTSALHLARHYGCRVVGVDLSSANLALAESRAAAEGLDGLVSFEFADAESLPFADGTFSAVLCECALCTFPDKETAAAEMVRVLAPNGRVGISDVVRNGDLPEALSGLLATIACVGDARSLETYEDLLTTAGLVVAESRLQPRALTEFIGQIRTRLLAAKFLATPVLPESLLPDGQRIREIFDQASAAITSGQLGYATISAIKPDSTEQSS